MSRMSRRRFLQISGLAAGASLLPMPVRWLGSGTARAFYQTQPNKIGLFKTALRGVGPGGIPVAASDLTVAPVTGVKHYTIDICQFKDQIVPTASGMGKTTLWGYNPAVGLGGNTTPTHLGGIIVAQRGVPIQITFRNKLKVSKPIIPIDKTNIVLNANESINRAAVHLHGGYVPWISDGGPFDWFDPYGVTGMSFLNNQVLNPGAAPGCAEYYYGNDQSARMMWYHDHAHGITRTNAYAGIASAYIIRDGFELNLINAGLPNYIENGGPELPLVFQDKIFVGSNIGLLDPTWSSLVASDATLPGSLWYPHIYERNRWRRGYSALGLPNPSIIPEMFGDTMLVNGTTFPEASVKAGRYRLRILNACNARFMNLQFYVANNSADGISLDALGNPTNTPFAPYTDPGTGLPSVLQIGTEGGFLPSPVYVPTNQPFNPVTLGGSLIMGPVERADVILDFSNYANQNIILYTDAPAPFPGGDPRNDYFPGFNVAANPVNAQTTPGFGPNTRILMRFKVGGPPAVADPPLTITTATNLQAGNDPLHMPPGVNTPPPVTRTRQLTLNESFDPWGRLIQMIGTNVPPVSLANGFGRALMDTPTETPANGDTEIWEIYNLTADVHPMHFHLVNVQVINRQPFDVATYNGTPAFLGPPVPPDPNESGWKETVRNYPGYVTRVIMKFTLPAIVKADSSVIPTPPSPRTGNHEYVWHCHILEHEEHDMMRPLIVS